MGQNKNLKYPKIEDYTLIGDSCAAALVSKYGSIDWCCIPNFNSPSIFSAVLDYQKGGRFSIIPKTDFESSQCYIENTNVVETHFETDSGKVCLTDVFCVREEEQKKRRLFPDHEILRVISCDAGHIPLQLHFEPRIFYGKKPARLKILKKHRFSISMAGAYFCFPNDAAGKDGQGP